MMDEAFLWEMLGESLGRIPISFLRASRARSGLTVE